MSTSRFILSCTTCAFRAPHKDEVAETFRYAPAAGYRYWGTAGPALGTPFVGAWLDTDRIKAAAKRAGLIGCTEVYGPQVDTASVDAAQRSVEAIVAQARYTLAMECPYLVFSGGRRQEGVGGLEASVVGLKELLARIEDMPVLVALEPHYRSQFRGVEDYDYIFERIDHPQLGVTVDTGHLHWAGVDTAAFIRRYGSRVWNVHLKDQIGPQSMPIGEGDIDLKGIIGVLHEIGYRGALALEIEPNDPDNLPRYVAESHPLLSGMVEEVTGRRPE